MADFPDWTSHLADFFALGNDLVQQVLYGRTRRGQAAQGGRDTLPPALVYDFIRLVAQEVGISMDNDPPAYGSMFSPMGNGMVDIPATLQELIVFMQDFENSWAGQQLFESTEPEAETEDGEEAEGGPDQDGLAADGIVQAPEPPQVEYTIGVAYTFPGWDGIEHAIIGTYSLSQGQANSLGGDSDIDANGRLELFFSEMEELDNVTPGGSSNTYILDVYITESLLGLPPQGLQGEAADTTQYPGGSVQQQEGQGTYAASASSGHSPRAIGTVPPKSLSAHHADLGFRNPISRLSYDSNAVRVDHQGVKYPARLIEGRESTYMDYNCPWLKANFVPNCCWLSCIIDLVNTSMRRKVLTYERLWTIMGRPGVFDPAEARRGLCLHDVEPIFEYFDRTVTVLDGENVVVYQRHRTTERKYNHIRPEVWSFLMTEHHVYALNETDLFKANIDGKRLNFSSNGSHYEEIKPEHAYEIVLPDFPSRELTKPTVVEAYEMRNKKKTVKGLVNSERSRKAPYAMRLLAPDPDDLLKPTADHPEYVTMHEALFHRRFDNFHLSVVTTRPQLYQVVLCLVQDYRYKPRIMVDHTGGLSCAMLFSLDNRATVSFRTIMPGQVCVENEFAFESVQQVVDFMRIKHQFVSCILSTDYQSYMHESVAQICHQYSRGGFFQNFTQFSFLQDPTVKYNSCDMNRLYPSTLQYDEVPKVDLFDRFEELSSTADYERLFPHDLILVSMCDTSSVYCDQPVALCFKKNLDKFLQRPSVFLCDPGSDIPLNERPTGCTYVVAYAVLCTHMVPCKISETIASVWTNDKIPRKFRKMALNMSIGCLGKKANRNNSAVTGTPCFCNREEAALHAEDTGDRIISLRDELFFALPTSEQVPRLQGGYLLYLWVLDHARWAMQETYDKLTDVGVNVVNIMCDELFYPSTQQHLVDEFIYDGDSESLEAFGKLKKHAVEVSIENVSRGSRSFHEFLLPNSLDFQIIGETTVPMNRRTTVPVLPAPDEYDIQNLMDHTRLLVKANVPGAGKSHAVLSRNAENCVVVCPTNSLCVEFAKKYPGCIAITLFRFLKMRLGKDDESSYTQIERGLQGWKQIEASKVLLLDEIYMYPQYLLNKLYSRLLITQATHVFATGDPNQLPPIEKFQHDRNKENFAVDFNDEFDLGGYVDVLHERRCKSIDHLFPYQLTLTKCKRATSTEDNERMEYICKNLRDPYAELGAVDFVKRMFLGIPMATAINMFASNPEDTLGVCYYNRTCRQIANIVNPGGLIKEGVRLVNRKRYTGKGGVLLHVNYEYVVKQVLDDTDGGDVIVTNVDQDVDYLVKRSHVENHMMWWRTRTCHSLQGTSVSGAVVIFDLTCPHMSKEFIYVALTRARNLNQVCYVMN